MTREELAAKLGIPVSSVEPQIRRESRGQGEGLDETLTGYAVKQNDSLGLMFDPSGNQIGTYTPVKPNGGIFGSFFEELGKAIGTLAPVAISIFAPELLPAIGSAMGASGAAATALGGAVISGGSALAQGKSVEDVLSSAAFGAAGGYAGSEAVKAAGATGTTGAALGGAVSGGTQAALTGKDVGQAALRGGLSAGLTSGIKQGLDVLNPPTEKVDYSLSSGKSGLGLNPYAKGETGLTASFPTNAPVFNEDGTVDYSFSGVQTPSGEGLKASIPGGSSFTSESSPANKELAGILSKGLTTSLFSKPSKPSGSTGGGTSPATSPAKSTTIGEAVGASPMAFGAADVLGVDTTPGEVESKKRAGTEEYPWGEPTGTSALKQGLGI